MSSTNVDDAKIQRPLDFQRAMLDRKPGQRQLAVLRSGDPLTWNLPWADVPDGVKPVGQPAWELLGVELKSIATEEFRKNHRRDTEAA